MKLLSSLLYFIFGIPFILAGYAWSYASGWFKLGQDMENDATRRLYDSLE